MFFKLTNKLNTKILFILFSLFPLSFLIGNLIINALLILVGIIFFFNENLKKYINFEDKYFNILFFLFITLLVNLYFSQNINLSYPRVFKFIFIILFILSFKSLIESNNKEAKKIYKVWFMLFFLVSIDLLFEFYFGSNLLGFKSHIPGRLASFKGDELNIGNYICAFSLITLAYFYYNISKSIKLNLLLLFFIIFISLIVGERANFIKTFLMLLIFASIAYKIPLKFKLLFSSILIISVLAMVSFNEGYKKRFIDQPIFILSSADNIVENSVYGAHYLTSLKVFKNYPYFGVGIKNFRVESYRSEYKIKNSDWTGGSTHTHQYHFELLSETGLFGYISF